MLRRDGVVLRPSDGAPPKRLAFIQCVGSRDAKLGHLWCSSYCCGSALRAARLIKRRRPETGVTVFFIDIQTFGRDFGTFFQDARKEVRLVRAIPGDVFQTGNAGLRLAYSDDATRQSCEEVFDLLVLSVGMLPPRSLAATAGALGFSPASGGFVDSSVILPAGVFAAGAVRGPMGIGDAIADARRAAWQLLGFLRRDREQAGVSTSERMALCDSFIAAKRR
jgi:heterodisulfide reductase subunit A2